MVLYVYLLKRRKCTVKNGLIFLYNFMARKMHSNSNQVLCAKHVKQSYATFLKKKNIKQCYHNYIQI